MFNTASAILVTILLEIEAINHARMYRPRLASCPPEAVFSVELVGEAVAGLVELEVAGCVEGLPMSFGFVGPKSRLPQLGHTLNLLVSFSPHD